MATILEHAVKILENLLPSEKHYAQVVAKQFLDIHLMGLTPPSSAVHMKLPPTQLLHGLLSHLPPAELESFSATVTLMLMGKAPSSEDEPAVTTEEEAVPTKTPASTTPSLRSEREPFGYQDLSGPPLGGTLLYCLIEEPTRILHLRSVHGKITVKVDGYASLQGSNRERDSRAVLVADQLGQLSVGDVINEEASDDSISHFRDLVPPAHDTQEAFAYGPQVDAVLQNLTYDSFQQNEDENGLREITYEDVKLNTDGLAVADAVRRHVKKFNKSFDDSFYDTLRPMIRHTLEEEITADNMKSTFEPFSAFENDADESKRIELNGLLWQHQAPKLARRLQAKWREVAALAAGLQDDQSQKPTADTETEPAADGRSESDTESSEQTANDPNRTKELADMTTASDSASQPARPEVPFQPSYDLPEQSGRPTSHGDKDTPSPHKSDNDNASSSKAAGAMRATHQSHRNKRKAQEEPLADGEVHSQSTPLRPTKFHKTGLNHFAGAPHAGPDDDHYQAPVPVATQSSEQASPVVQARGIASSSRASSASDGTYGESRRTGNASTLRATSESSHTSDGTASDKSYGDSHDLYKGNANWDAYRYPTGTKVPMNKDVQEHYQAGTLRNKLVHEHPMGMVYWLKIHARIHRDAMMSSPDETARLVLDYLQRLERFEDNYYGPGIPLSLPAGTVAQQVSAPPSGGHVSGQSNIPQGHQQSGPTLPNAPNMSTPTLQDIVRWVKARTPVQFQPPMLKNNLKNFVKDVLGEQFRRDITKPQLTTKIFNHQTVLDALRHAGLQVPNAHGQQIQQVQALPNSGLGAQDFDGRNAWNAQDYYQQSQLAPQSSRGVGPAPSSRATKPVASNSGGSMVSRAGVQKVQTQARPSSFQRDPHGLYHAYMHQQGYANAQVSGIAQNQYGGINHAVAHALPSQFENGRAKNVPHVLQAQQKTYYNQPSRPEAIDGSSAANAINLDDDGLDAADEDFSHIATATPRDASQGQPARATQPVDPAALSQWNKTKHGDPTKADTFARRGRAAAPMSVTNGALKSTSAGVSKDRRKKTVDAERVASPQRASQLARARASVADLAGFDLQQHAPPRAYGGAASFGAPAAPGPDFPREQLMQNLQRDQTPFGSDDTIDLEQDEELYDQNFSNPHVLDPQLFQPFTDNTTWHGHLDTQYGGSA